MKILNPTVDGTAAQRSFSGLRSKGAGLVYRLESTCAGVYLARGSGFSETSGRSGISLIKHLSAAGSGSHLQSCWRSLGLLHHIWLPLATMCIGGLVSWD